MGNSGSSRYLTISFRLECMQTAVLTHIERILDDKPNKKVLLVTFNNEVTIYGQDIHVLTGNLTIISSLTCMIVLMYRFLGDKLNDKQELIKIGKTIVDWNKMECIHQSANTLMERVSH
jgi:hypothetical protein